MRYLVAVLCCAIPCDRWMVLSAEYKNVVVSLFFLFLFCNFVFHTSFTESTDHGITYTHTNHFDSPCCSLNFSGTKVFWLLYWWVKLIFFVYLFHTSVSVFQDGSSQVRVCIPNVLLKVEAKLSISFMKSSSSGIAGAAIYLCQMYIFNGVLDSSSSSIEFDARRSVYFDLFCRVFCLFSTTLTLWARHPEPENYFEFHSKSYTHTRQSHFVHTTVRAYRTSNQFIMSRQQTKRTKIPGLEDSYWMNKMTKYRK